MGIFYNWKLVKTVPHLWSEIGRNSANADNTVEYGETQMIDDSRDYADMIL